MEALQLHVNGPALIMSGTGDAGELEPLGTSVDGVTITIETSFKDVNVDQFGPEQPFDRQYFLQGVKIKCDLIWYDTTVLDLWLTGIPAAAVGGLTFGEMGRAGDLVVQNSLYSRLLVKSTPASTGLTTVEQCWNFPQCILIEQHEEKIGTEKTVWRLTFQALLTQASASQNAVLFNATCV